MRASALAATVAALLFGATAHAQAYTHKVLYSFCGEANCTDGNDPQSRLIADGAGNLFGTTHWGGTGSNPTFCEGPGCGTIYELIPNADKTAWTHKVIYNFCMLANCRDGAEPVGDLVMDTSGNLYGAAHSAGLHDGGIVYELSPNRKHTQWKLRILHPFCFYTENCTQGSNPMAGLTYPGAASGQPYDGTSPLYGGAYSGGGPYFEGTLYRLTPGAHRNWTYDVVYTFNDKSGGSPRQELIADGAGNLFGTVSSGNTTFNGGVFEFSAPPSGRQTGYKLLYAFCPQSGCADGSTPTSGPALGAGGKLYGVTSNGGANSSTRCNNNCGVLYAIVPKGKASPETVRYDFCAKADCADGAVPGGDLTMDGAGDIFGVTAIGGGNDGDTSQAGGGTVYEMKRNQRVLYRFCAETNCTDGLAPLSGVILDQAGDIFGTTVDGGAHFHGGTAFELVP